MRMRMRKRMSSHFLTDSSHTWMEGVLPPVNAILGKFRSVLESLARLRREKPVIQTAHKVLSLGKIAVG